MAAGEIYHISGSLLPSKSACKFLGGAVDDGVQIDALAAAAVVANHTSGTISAWIMVPDVTGTYGIVGAGQSAAVEYVYFAVAAGKLQLKAAQAGPDVNYDLITTSVVITPYKWHHVAFVQNAVKPKIYVDGVLVALTETDVTEPTYWFDTYANIDGMHIGCADSIAGGGALTLEFAGLISTVTIWSGTTTDGALTAAQIKLDYEGKDTGVTPYGQYTFTDTTLYTNLGTAAGSDGTKVGDWTRVQNASEFTARLQYEPAAAIVVADVVTNITITNDVGHALVVKAA